MRGNHEGLFCTIQLAVSDSNPREKWGAKNMDFNLSNNEIVSDITWSYNDGFNLQAVGLKGTRN